MRVAPARLNTAIATLFAVGSAGFVLGSVPALVTAIGGLLDGITYAVAAVFFTAASCLQLLQAQTPASTAVDTRTQHVPVEVRWWAPRVHEKGWWAAATQLPGTVAFNVSTIAALAHNATVAQQQRFVWRPDAVGSALFLISSAYAIAALGRFWRWRPHQPAWRIAWISMVGSILFAWSALGAYILPSGDVVSVRASVGGTLLGAVCFGVGAVLMPSAWRRSVGG